MPLRKTFTRGKYQVVAGCGSLRYRQDLFSDGECVESKSGFVDLLWAKKVQAKDGNNHVATVTYAGDGISCFWVVAG